MIQPWKICPITWVITWSTVLLWKPHLSPPLWLDTLFLITRLHFYITKSIMVIWAPRCWHSNLKKILRTNSTKIASNWLCYSFTDAHDARYNYKMAPAIWKEGWRKGSQVSFSVLIHDLSVPISINAVICVHNQTRIIPQIRCCELVGMIMSWWELAVVCVDPQACSCSGERQHRISGIQTLLQGKNTSFP